MHQIHIERAHAHIDQASPVFKDEFLPPPHSWPVQAPLVIPPWGTDAIPVITDGKGNYYLCGLALSFDSTDPSSSTVQIQIPDGGDWIVEDLQGNEWTRSGDIFSYTLPTQLFTAAVTMKLGDETAAILDVPFQFRLPGSLTLDPAVRITPQPGLASKRRAPTRRYLAGLTPLVQRQPLG